MSQVQVWRLPGVSIPDGWLGTHKRRRACWRAVQHQSAALRTNILALFGHGAYIVGVPWLRGPSVIGGQDERAGTFSGIRFGSESTLRNRGCPRKGDEKRY